RGIPARIAAMDSTDPITPVLATSTNSSATPSSRATSAAISRASPSPCAPVHALAFPLLMMIACATPDWIFSWLTSTGAALTVFVVNSAAAEARRSAATRARSLLAVLTPQCTPAARKPLGEVTLPAIISTPALEMVAVIAFPPRIFLRIEPGRAQPSLLRQAEHDIHVLHGLPARAFDEIVERRHGDGDAGAAIHPHRDVAEI